MKQILADITPMGSNNLFVTHYWPDKQTDPPLHYHEDYMLCLTLHVRGQRIMDLSLIHILTLPTKRIV